MHNSQVFCRKFYPSPSQRAGAPAILAQPASRSVLAISASPSDIRAVGMEE